VAEGGLFVKRLLLGAASAVVSCSSLVVVMGGTSFAGTPGATAMANAPLMRASREPGSKGLPCTDPCLSTNWSGYAQWSARHTFTGISDTFVVPTVDAGASGTEYAADWVGIGGFSDPTLVQAGIQTVVRTPDRKGDRATTVTYGAWTEILPQAELPLSLPISPGNVIKVTVEETAKNRWTMTVDNTTTGQSGVRTVNYKSSGMSAEAIHERPCLRGNCSTLADLATLAPTSDVTADPGYFSEAPPGAAPVNEPLLSSGGSAMTLFEVIMTANGDLPATPIATPSVPNSADDGFTVADGAVAPSAPSV
jgi:peptidase A4-like protein